MSGKDERPSQPILDRLRAGNRAALYAQLNALEPATDQLIATTRAEAS